jgi:hypothetical protein
MKRIVLGLVLATGCAKGSDFAGTAPPAPEPSRGAASIVTESDPAAGEDSGLADVAPSQRPGLGTEFGESRNSSMTTVPFTRSHGTPDVTLALFYDDFAGVRGMAERAGSALRSESRTSTDDGTFVLSVVDGNGELLTAADVAGKRFAIGAAGQRYSIGIENHSSARFEVVASVDGLDVIDGDEAAFHKRGYVLEPFSSVMIDGWRTSQQTVAAFRFGSVADSYAERRGMGRNIGVIGAAFFHEEGGVAWRDLHHADAIPTPFAPPPPARRF